MVFPDVGVGGRGSAKATKNLYISSDLPMFHVKQENLIRLVSCMQIWQIRDSRIRFCDECSRSHAGVILMLEARWIGTERDIGLRCDACGCTDYELMKFGRFRKIFTFFAVLNSKVSGRLLKIFPSVRSKQARALRRVR